MAEVIAHKQTAYDADGITQLTQYVHPSLAGLARKYLIEEGYTVSDEPLTELPEGVSLDIKPIN